MIFVKTYEITTWSIANQTLDTKTIRSWTRCGSESVNLSVISDSCVTPWTVAHQAPLSMKSPGKNTGVCSPSFVQGIFPTQGSEQSEVRPKNMPAKGN